MSTTVHPNRAHELHLGRSERSPEASIDVEDFVDLEKAKATFPIKEEETVDLTTLVKAWPMFLNDSVGDCTCAGAAHMKQCADAQVGMPFTVSDADVALMYEQSGWRPGKPETDQGWTLEQAATYMETVGLLGRPGGPLVPDIDGVANVSLTDDDAQQVALELFGGLYEGCLVSTQDLQDYREGKPWTPNSAEVAGGHCITRPQSVLRKSGLHVTWGGLVQATEAWEKEKIDELRVMIPKDWEAKLPEYLLAAGIVDFSKLSSLLTQFAS
jgi:hypothetical protein